MINLGLLDASPAPSASLEEWEAFARMLRRFAGRDPLAKFKLQRAHDMIAMLQAERDGQLESYVQDRLDACAPASPANAGSMAGTGGTQGDGTRDDGTRDGGKYRRPLPPGPAPRTRESRALQLPRTSSRRREPNAA